jgi:hypothetical protein
VDKASAEKGVQVVEVLAALRNRVFFTLDEANAAIRELVAAVNARPLTTNRTLTRRRLFEEQEKPLLKPLPAEPFVIGPAISWRPIITSASRVLGALPADRPARRCVLHGQPGQHLPQGPAGGGPCPPGGRTGAGDGDARRAAQSSRRSASDAGGSPGRGLGGALGLLADRIFADADHPNQAARQVCCDWAGCTAPRLCKPPRRPR